MNVIDMHSEVWRQVQAKRPQMPHALLLAGQRGIGKFDLARELVTSLLCETPAASGQACARCRACHWLEQGSHPDLRLVQPKTLADDEDTTTASDEGSPGKKKASQQITIDQIRALDDFLQVGTHRHGARIVLLNPAEAMNRATANALLKSLEEPIAGTLFLLVSSEANRLLPTIRSRCQSILVRPPSRAAAVAWLRQSGVGDEAETWLALAGGAPLLACELAGSSERSLLDSLLAQFSRAENLEPLSAAALLDKLVKADKRPLPLKRTIEWAQKWLFDLSLASHGLSPRYFLGHESLLQRLARASDAGKLLAFNRKTLQYRGQCEQPLNSRLFLEDFFLNYANLFRIS